MFRKLEAAIFDTFEWKKDKKWFIDCSNSWWLIFLSSTHRRSCAQTYSCVCKNMIIIRNQPIFFFFEYIFSLFLLYYAFWVCIQKSTVWFPAVTYVRGQLKGQFTPTYNMHIFPLTCRVIHPLKLFWCELPRRGDINFREVRFLLNVMALGLWRFKPKNKQSRKTQRQFLCTEILKTQLLRIISRPCCEQFRNCAFSHGRNANQPSSLS